MNFTVQNAFLHKKWQLKSARKTPTLMIRINPDANRLGYYCPALPVIFNRFCAERNHDDGPAVIYKLSKNYKVKGHILAVSGSNNHFVVVLLLLLGLLFVIGVSS
jgi:hypothetical protein